MTATESDWVVVPYGPDHRRTMESLAGGEYDPATGKYGIDWHVARRSAPYATVNGYGYNGIYLEVFALPDGRILIQRTDKHAPMSKFRLFDSADSYLEWVANHNRACPEIDPETGREFQR